MDKIIGKSRKSQYFRILHFVDFFGQPFGENISSKNESKTKIEKLKKFKVFKQPNYSLVTLACSSMTASMMLM